MDQKIKCESCGKIIAEGKLPATVKIKCPHANCGVMNNLDKPVKTKPYAQRVSEQMEKK